MMMRRFPGLLAAAAGLFVLAAAPAHAQDDGLTVRGRVIGPDNATLEGQRVVLHRVDSSGGATVAEAVSGADGSFELLAPANTDPEAVYFVAARYADGELYIGPPFRADEVTGMEQLLQVGVPSMSASALMEQDAALPPMPRGRASETPGWLLLLIPLLGVAGVALYALRPRRGMRADRALLIRIAELDERMADAPAAEHETLRAERARLMDSLRAG
jgi:hypothetical protein